MSVEFEARAEAEKRYPVIPDAPFGDSASVSVKRKAFVAGYIAGATRPVTDAEADAAQAAFHEYVVGADEPLTGRDLRMGRQAWKVALEAAREAS